jgi:hypothetical protein
MKSTVTVNIDIRKTFPLGASLHGIKATAYAAFEKGLAMGPGSRALPGYTTHAHEYQRTMNEARQLHSALLYIAALIGPEAAANVNDLAWALNTDGYTGLPRTTPLPDAARALGVDIAK